MQDMHCLEYILLWAGRWEYNWWKDNIGRLNVLKCKNVYLDPFKDAGEKGYVVQEFFNTVCILLQWCLYSSLLQIQAQHFPMAQHFLIPAYVYLNCYQGSFNNIGGRWLVFTNLGAGPASVELGLWEPTGSVPGGLVTARRRRANAAPASWHFLACSFFFFFFFEATRNIFAALLIGSFGR